MMSKHAYALILRGLVVSLIGVAVWFAAVVAGCLDVAIGAAAVGTLGSLTCMAGVLEERRHELGS